MLSSQEQRVIFHLIPSLVTLLHTGISFLADELEPSLWAGWYTDVLLIGGALWANGSISYLCSLCGWGGAVTQLEYPSLAGVCSCPDIWCCSVLAVQLSEVLSLWEGRAPRCLFTAVCSFYCTSWFLEKQQTFFMSIMHLCETVHHIKSAAWHRTGTGTSS